MSRNIFKKNNKKGFTEYYDKSDHFISQKHLDEKRELLRKIVSDKKMDPDKENKMILLLDELNKKFAKTIAISGKQGSGKTSVVNETVIKSFLPKKNFGNSFALFLLYLRLFIVFPFSKKGVSNANSKIAMRRWNFIHLNVWNLFAHVNVGDYKDFNKTIFSKEVMNCKCEKLSNSKNDELRNSTTMEYSTVKRDLSDERNERISNIYIKKSLWVAFLVAIKFKNHEKKMNDALYYNKFSDSSYEETLFKKWFTPKLFFHILLPTLITVIFFVVEKYVDINGKKISDFFDLNSKFEFSGIVSGVSYGISMLAYGVDKLYEIREKNTKDLNNFLLSPISNELMHRVIEKKTKRKLIILHLTEIDRLNQWLSNNGDVESREGIIYEIVNSYSLSYSTNHMKIVMEIDVNIEEIISKKSKKVFFGDSLKKTFNEIIKIESFDENQLLVIVNYEAEKEVNSVKELMWHMVENLCGEIYDRKLLIKPVKFVFPKPHKNGKPNHINNGITYFGMAKKDAIELIKRWLNNYANDDLPKIFRQILVGVKETDIEIDLLQEFIVKNSFILSLEYNATRVFSKEMSKYLWKAISSELNQTEILSWRNYSNIKRFVIEMLNDKWELIPKYDAKDAWTEVMAVLLFSRMIHAEFGITQNAKFFKRIRVLLSEGEEAANLGNEEKFELFESIFDIWTFSKSPGKNRLFFSTQIRSEEYSTSKRAFAQNYISALENYREPWADSSWFKPFTKENDSQFIFDLSQQQIELITKNKRVSLDGIENTQFFKNNTSTPNYLSNFIDNTGRFVKLRVLKYLEKNKGSWHYERVVDSLIKYELHEFIDNNSTIDIEKQIEIFKSNMAKEHVKRELDDLSIDYNYLISTADKLIRKNFYLFDL